MIDSMNLDEVWAMAIGPQLVLESSESFYLEDYDDDPDDYDEERCLYTFEV